MSWHVLSERGNSWISTDYLFIIFELSRLLENRVAFRYHLNGFEFGFVGLLDRLPAKA